MEVRIYLQEEGLELVACVEFVSPSNKDRPAEREAFVSKCAAYLHEGVGLVVVDIVTTRHADLHAALAIYRARFQPSAQLTRPYAIVAANVIAADTDEAARKLFTSVQQTWANRFRGQRTQLAPPIEDIETYWSPAEKRQASAMLACTFAGSPETIAPRLAAFLAETQADELIVASPIFDHGARVRSLELAAQVRDGLAEGRAVPLAKTGIG